MQAYTELIPPTAVTHAVSLPFLGSSDRSLVVAKTSVLDIFTTGRLADSDESRLSLVASYPLSGTVTALRSISIPNTKSGGDALLISFKDAKLSLVEWDPENYRISTISIHYYEGENVALQPFGPSLPECESILTVDPSSRCAALKFGPRQLAVLPFRQQGDDLGGEDGYDAEMEDAPASATLKRTQTGLSENADQTEGKLTPYKASFVLPLTALDPSLTHPVDMAFLHEYREPTLGILGAAQQASTALLDERKDVLMYSVFTLDLEQRASTNLVSVPKLPSDLWKVMPLPMPVGGALLVGTNELVHVDQSGKASAVAVNEFATKASNLNMSDQSHLNLKLENCEVETLDAKSGDLLIILHDGALATLSFKLSGRSVAGMDVTRVNEENCARAVDASPSCVAALAGKELFVGSDTGDSRLLRWSKSTSTLSRKRSHAQMLGQEPMKDEDESDDSGDDDLYGETTQTKKRSMSSSAQVSAVYSFESQDRLPNLGAINSFCFGRSSSDASDKLQIAAGTGRYRSSRLALLSREIKANRARELPFSGVKNVWSVYPPAKGSEAGKEMLFVYDGEVTKIHEAVSEGGEERKYEERTGTEYEAEGETSFIGTVANGSTVVHCRPNEIRTYDSAELSLDAILPQENDEGTELKIVETRFCDPYVLVLRDDSSLQILKADEKGAVDALELDDDIKGGKWMSSCLHAMQLLDDTICAYLLNKDGSLNVFAAPDFKQVYKAPMLSQLPPVLSQDAPQRRFGAKETLTEILITDVGTTGMEKTLLVLRNSMDDLTLYERFFHSEDSMQASSIDSLRFRKVPFAYFPKYDETAASEDAEGRPAPLRAVTIGDHKTIVIPGSSPTLILREAQSLPHAIPLHTASRTRSLVPMQRPNSSRAFALVDVDGNIVEYELRKDEEYSTGWAIDRLSLGSPAEEVRHVDFHEKKGMYVVATCRDVDFYFAPDDTRHEHQDDISLRPQVPQYTLHLLSARTHNIIHSLSLPSLETVTSMKVMPLEISEHTHEQRTLIAVGTAALRGEDMPAKGALTIFEIQTVVPDPDLPESGIRLHAISREETRGAVTAVESFQGGLVGTAQGLKLMIRGLKEDGSCLPVAFLDGQCHCLNLKTFLHSGMWLAADAWKGLWFGGFTEEPFKLSVLGKSRTQMEVLAAEFLPFDEGLFLMVAGADAMLHCLQYDPENPKTLSGTRLLHRGSFHLGQTVTHMRLLPSSLAPLAIQQAALASGKLPDPSSPETPKLYHNLLATASGALALLTPLDESSYRRLSALQTHLTSVLEHPAGLNPRAYRSPEGAEGGRSAVVDGEIVRRLGEVGSARRSEVLGRAGMDAWVWRSDAEIVFGGGLGWF